MIRTIVLILSICALVLMLAGCEARGTGKVIARAKQLSEAGQAVAWQFQLEDAQGTRIWIDVSKANYGKYTTGCTCSASKQPGGRWTLEGCW